MGAGAVGHCSDVILAGSSLVFSERFVRIVGFEFEGLTVSRVSSDQIDFLKTFAPERHTLLVLEDGVATDIDVSPRLLADVARKAQVVVTYRSLETARSLYRSAQRDPELASLRFLPLDIQMDRWLSLLQLLACGEGYVPQELLEEFPADVSTRPPCALSSQTNMSSNSTFDDLTPREQDVLRLVAAGLQNKAIAERLGRSEHTVKIHIHHINAKLSVSNRTAAAAWYATHVAPLEEALSDE